jgi:lysophospholipase L1-like esterase
MMNLKLIAARVVLVAFGVALPFIVLEGGLRIEHRIRKGTPLLLNPAAKWDDHLGWEGKEHIFNPLSERPLLVIGDSFTEGLDVPSGQMWFAQLAAMYPERGLIAYGGLGYGTLQQLRTLQRYRDRGVNPSTVVLQLCTNDILNNLFDLEKHSLLQRPPGPRPYWENGSVVLKFPRENDWLLLPLVSWSRFAYRMSTHWDALVAEQARAGRFNSIEHDIQKFGFAFEPFRRASQVTQILLDRFKRAAGDASLILMLVDDVEPYTRALRDIADKLQLQIVIPARVTPLGVSDRLPDGTHLNASGNRLVGDTFTRIAKSRGLIP